MHWVLPTVTIKNILPPRIIRRTKRKNTSPKLYVAIELSKIIRAWHLLKYILGSDEITVYSDVDQFGNKRDVLTPLFMCPKCLKYQQWSFGCDDDQPEVCDDCYVVNDDNSVVPSGR